MVVAIHFNSRKYIADPASWNGLIQQFITDGIARIAVPYFALVAGLMLYEGIQRGQSYRHILRSRARTILVPFLLTGAIIFLPEWIYKVHHLGVPIDTTLRTVIDAMWLRPWPVQLWFLRDLVVLIIVHPILVIALRFKGVVSVFAIGLLWVFNINLLPDVSDRSLINIETLFYFHVGIWISKNNQTVDQAFTKPNATAAWLSVLAVCCLFALYVLLYQREFLIPQFDLPSLLPQLVQKTAILFGALQLVRLCRWIPFRQLVYASQFAFFVFLFHTVPLNRLVVYFSDQFIADAWKFYFTFPLGALLTFVIAILFRKWLPKFYSILSGGR